MTLSGDAFVPVHLAVEFYSASFAAPFVDTFVIDEVGSHNSQAMEA